MKKFGTMIIKPDAYNVEDLNLIKNILEKYDLYEDNLCFIFNNYPEVVLEYREKDVIYKNLTNVTSDLPDGMNRQSPEVELRNCKVALSAYKKFFDGKRSLVLLVPTHGRDNEEFFDSMYKAKKEIRSELKKKRDYCYSYINFGTDKQEMKKISVDEYEKRHNQDRHSVNLAHVDGIHLEDKECFFDNFCLSFMVSMGIIKRANQTSLTKEIKSLNVDEWV